MTAEILHHRCWNCGKQHNRVSGVTPDPEYSMPKRGDPGFCTGCAQWMIFDDSIDGGTREPTTFELAEIHEMPEVSQIEALWLLFKQENNNG